MVIWVILYQECKVIAVAYQMMVVIAACWKIKHGIELEEKKNVRNEDNRKKIKYLIS